jgi:hypothetical protein
MIVQQSRNQNGEMAVVCLNGYDQLKEMSAHFDGAGVQTHGIVILTERIPCSQKM